MAERQSSTLPTGTVTFLFTDIEGSTRLYRQLGAAYEDVLDQHRQICRRAFAEFAGAEVGCPGDGFVVAFASAAAAVEAAVMAQRDLVTFPWPNGVKLRVRMGVHAGAARLTSTGGTYVGLALHEAARVGGAGHGGQIIVSEPALRLAEHDLPFEVTAVNLGEHELKDLEGRRRLFELRGPGLPGGFPSLRSHSTATGNLPSPPSSFLGRAGDLAAVCDALSSSSVVTLLGTGGVGKTRLALAAAAAVAPRFADGAWFVDLSPLRRESSADDVAAALGAVMGFELTGGTAGLARAMSQRDTLVVIDNCEHVVASAAAVVDAIVRESAELRVLATSREALALRAERVYPVSPLLAADAIDLFEARARDVAPDFAATPDTRPEIDRICTSLDRLPLAIELAARRVRTLTLSAIAQRLEDRFALLTGGDRSALDRQRTLEATVDWSYELLSEDERVLLRRLSVFAGGWTLEAAERVCGDVPLPANAVLDLMTSLIERSLVTVDRSGEEVRFNMLETIRAYARARLDVARELELMRSRHLSWFADLSWEALQSMGFGARAWFTAMAAEADNLHAAVAWSLEGGDKDDGLRLAAGAGIFGMDTRGNFFFASRDWIEQLLAQGAAADDASLRCQALASAGNVAGAQGDVDAMTRFGEAGLALATHHSLPPYAHAQALGMLAIGLTATDPERALAMHREVESLAKAAGAHGFRVYALSFLSTTALEAGQLDEARAAAEEALDLARRLGASSGIARSLNALASIARAEGDLVTMAALAEEAIATADAAGAAGEAAAGLGNLAIATFAAGEVERAAAHLDRAVERLTDVGQWGAVARVWAGAAQMLMISGDAARARVVVDRLVSAAEVVGPNRGMVDLITGVARRAASVGLDDISSRLDEFGRAMSGTTRLG